MRGTRGKVRGAALQLVGRTRQRLEVARLGVVMERRQQAVQGFAVDRTQPQEQPPVATEALQREALVVHGIGVGRGTGHPVIVRSCGAYAALMLRIPGRPRLLVVLVLSCVVSCIVLVSTAIPGAASPEEGVVQVPHHALTVRLDPKPHRLVAEDVLALPPSGEGETRTITFDLAPRLLLRAIRIEGGETLALPERAEDGSFPLDLPAESIRVRFHYVGTIFDAVQKADDLSWVVGDNTTGVISDKGIYLSPASRWYPRPRERAWPLARFSITTIVPTPYLTVTQGTLPVRTTLVADAKFAGSDVVLPTRVLEEGEEPARGERRWTRSTSQAEVATDGCHLSADRWVTKSRVVRGVTIATYFAPQDEDAQDLWLDETAKTVERYAKVLGPYPHSKFDVVSNFFQSGYGMPGWTLLGDRVIRYVTMKAKYTGGIPPGYLDHEYVHGWYGNGLAVDYASGNWCEAITTYLANYYAKELQSADAATEHRRGVLEKFCIRVRGKSDYALRKFVTKTEDADNDVGYGKGSMFFHVLRRRVGDEVFWKTVRDVTTKHVGKVVTWDDWLRAFDADAEGTHGAAMLPLLDRPGVPAVTLGSVNAGPAIGSGTMLTVEITQSGPPITLAVPVRVTYVDGSVEDLVVESDDTDVAFLRPIDKQPAIVELDPDCHMLRRIPDAELPFCLNRTLEQADGVIVVRNHPEVFGGLADRLARATGWKRLDQVDVPQGVHRVVLGVTEGGGALEAGGETFEGPRAAVMATRKTGEGYFETRYEAASVEAAARVGYATYYGWDGWIGFQGGRVAKRGMLRPEPISTRKVLAKVERHASAAEQRIRATIEKLCSAEFEGRRPGTAGHAKALDWIEAQVRASDPNGRLDIERQTFPLGLVPYPEVVPEWQSTSGALDLAGVRFRPLPGTTPARYASALSRVIVLSGAMEPEALVAKIAEHREGGRMILIAEGAGQGDAPTAWVDHPGDLTQHGQAAYEAAKMGRRGPRPAPVVEPWISGRRARLPALPKIHGAAFVVTGADTTAVLAWIEKAQAGTLVLTIPPTSIPLAQGRNLVVRLGGLNKVPRYRTLGAHYDALGQDGDRFFAGADDNASGVACLLEVIRNTVQAVERGGEMADFGSIRFVFFDAEEWGLRGSTHFAASRSESRQGPFVNVDSVGRATSQPTYVLGHSHHADLAASLRGLLKAQGLGTPERSIDRFAYPWGSDHWPFHQRGIPAVSLWATDYAVMNTPKDTVDGVEVEGIAKIARALSAWLGVLE